MVKAGPPVDEVIDELTPHLDPNDIIIDGGNSLFTDTARRYKTCEARNLRYVGMGVSGGEEGALEGPSMMPGGDRAAYDRIAPILTKMAALVDGTPCCTYIGPEGAGHYVKMVHNGIEYADMQLIAEAYDLMKSVYGLDAPAMAEIFQAWKQGDLDSYLIEITAAVLRKTDGDGKPLVDAILDEAGEEGDRPLDGSKRARARRAADRDHRGGLRPRALRARRDAAGDGEEDAASGAADGEARKGGDRRHPRRPLRLKDHRLRPGLRADVRRVRAIQLGPQARRHGDDRRGGCIIRARFLDRIKEAYDRNPKLSNLLLDDYFREGVMKAEDTWRRVIVLAASNGVGRRPLSALAYYDGLRRARGPANLLQGLRDYFGAHTYRRLDKEGSFHTRWSQDGSEVRV